jgi:hypothetical protein
MRSPADTTLGDLRPATDRLVSLLQEYEPEERLAAMAWLLSELAKKAIPAEHEKPVPWSEHSALGGIYLGVANAIVGATY